MAKFKYIRCIVQPDGKEDTEIKWIPKKLAYKGARVILDLKKGNPYNATVISILD
jgi:hypothetical protein